MTFIFEQCILSKGTDCMFHIDVYIIWNVQKSITNAAKPKKNSIHVPLFECNDSNNN